MNYNEFLKLLDKEINENGEVTLSNKELASKFELNDFFVTSAVNLLKYEKKYKIELVWRYKKVRVITHANSSEE